MSSVRTAASRGDGADQNERLLAQLCDLNVASKEWVIRQYDHEVQGRSVIKPLVGPNFGPSDAAVLRPRLESDRGIAVACGLCPQRGDVDPYWMAIAAVDEALRNVICVGAAPERTAILDNFCWPKVDTPESMGALVRACRGAFDASIAYGLPFISGKDSLNNEFALGEDEAKRVGLPRQLAIPHTLLISALGIVDNVRNCVSMDLKATENVLVFASAPVEDVGLDSGFALHTQVSQLIRGGKVRSAHDLSDGGLGVALAEMCIASGLGLKIDLTGAVDANQLFAEPMSTYLLGMTSEHATATGLPIVGTVGGCASLTIHCGGRTLVDLPVAELDRAWRTPLSEGEGRL
jgi:phosphoribosylformylglycinamidine synthase